MDYSKVSKLLANHSPAGLATVVSGGAFKTPPHIAMINKLLSGLIIPDRQRIIVNMPPRHGKSHLISTYFPFWYLGRKPDNKVMLTSYQNNLAIGWGRTARNLYSEHGMKYFNNKVSRGLSSAGDWGIYRKSGSMFSTGIAAGGTGRGYNVLIVDDPVKDAEAAFSPVIREKNWDWFQSVATTRQAPGAAIIIVMTRWHHDDLVGRILKQERDEWTVLDIPAIAKIDNDILGRKKGEALWPDMFPLKELEKIRASIGPYWFSALYQQEPISGEYQIFKPEWWKFYEESKAAIQSKCVIKFMTMDTAFKDNEQNDYSVCIVWGVADGKLYIIDMWRDKVLFPALVAKTITYYEMYSPQFIAIEDAASGQSLIPSLKKELKGRSVNIKPIETMNKSIRAHSISSTVEQGLVFLPKDAIWTADFINELSEFPAGKHDDQVDAFTIGVQLFNNRYKAKSTSAGVSNITERISGRSSRSSKQRSWGGY